MEQIAQYLALARTLPREAFAARFSHLWLLRRPEHGSLYPIRGPGAPPTILPFDTAPLPIGAPTALWEDGSAGQGDWRVAPLSKRAANPFIEWISVGRATNCDVVLQLPFISKVHCRLKLDDSSGQLSLIDQNSANGTAINGMRIEPGVATPIRPGDGLKLGPLELEIIDSRAFHKLLQGLL